MTTLDDKILVYLTGALDPEQAAEVEALIASDPALESEVAFHRQILDAGEALPTEEPPLELSVGLMDAAVDAIHESREKRRKPESMWEKLFITFTHPALIGSMAVIMVSVVSVGLWRSLEEKPSTVAISNEAVATVEVETENAEKLASLAPAAEAEEVEVVLDEPVAVVAEAESEVKDENRAWERNEKTDPRKPSIDSAPQEGGVKARTRNQRSRPTRVAKSKRSARSVAPAPAPSAAPKPKPAPSAKIAESNFGVRGRGAGGGGLSRLSKAPASAPSSAIQGAGAARVDSSSEGKVQRQDPERVLYASRQLGRFRMLRRARSKAAEELPDAGNSTIAPWERELLRLIQNKRPEKAVQMAKRYRAQNPELLKEALFVYLYAEALFGSGQKAQAKSMALSIEGHALYGEVVKMLMEAIDDSE